MAYKAILNGKVEDDIRNVDEADAKKKTARESKKNK